MNHRVDLVSLAIQDVGALDGRIEIGPFSCGLSVISARSETAKATVVDALRAVLFERHDARHDGIKALQAAGTRAAPEIRVELSIAGERLSVHKRFLERPFVEVRLHRDGDALTGVKAEELLLACLQGATPREPGRAQNDGDPWTSALDPAARHAELIAQLGAVDAQRPALDDAWKANVAAEAEAHARELQAEEAELALAMAEAELAAVHHAIAERGSSSIASDAALTARRASALSALIPAHRSVRRAAAAVDEASPQVLRAETIRAQGAITACKRRAAELRMRILTLDVGTGIEAKRLPLVLEDPPAGPDDARRRSIVQILRGASSERQIIVLTGHPSRFGRLLVEYAVDLDLLREARPRAPELDTLAG